MPRGKPFICWLSSPGEHHNVELSIGDVVDLRLDDGEIFRGKIGMHRKGLFPYFVRHRNVEHQVASTSDLRPIVGMEGLGE